MSLVASKLQLVPRPVDPGVVPDTLTHAYSTKRIRSGHTGPCLRVRRSSDNTEQDIPFVAGQLDTASLLAFCGSSAGSAGYVVTWYSQLPGVGDATQSIREFQPRICLNGVVETLGTSGKPALYFENPEKQLIPPNGYTATASSTTAPNTATLACDRAPNTSWISDTTYSSGTYTGAVSTTIDGTALLGEWFQLVLPNPVVVASLGIVPRPGVPTQGPKQCTLAASADNGATWTSIYRTTTGTYTDGVETRFVVNATKAYDRFRLIVDATAASAVSFSTFAFYGTDASPLPKEVSLVPPMIADTHGSYVASASSVFSSAYPAYHVFDSSGSTYLAGQTPRYTNGQDYTGSTSTTIAGIGPVLGEYVQIQLASPACVRRYGVVPRPTLAIRAPGTWYVVGSNDGSTWTVVDQRQDIPSTQYTDTVETSFTVTTTPAAYRYFRLIVTKLAGTTSTATSLDLGQWALYGYEVPGEVQFVPTMTANTYAGFVASASSSAAPPYYLFDRNTTTYTIGTVAYTNGTTYTGSASTLVSGLGPVSGEWVQLQTPVPTSLTRYGIIVRSSYNFRAPGQFVVVGSNDGLSWSVIDQRDTIQAQYSDNTETSFTVTTPRRTYTYFRLIAKTLSSTSASSSAFDLAEWRLYNTEPPPAFFTVPAGFPASSPQALVSGMAPAYEQNLVPASGFTATASTEFTATYPALRLFDRSQVTSWASANLTYTNGTEGAVYTGSVTTSVAGLGNVLGEWVQIRLPAAARLTRYAFYPRANLTIRSPRDFVVVGSNDGTTWEVVDQVAYSGFTYTNYKPTTFLPKTTTKSFSYYRLIVQKIFTNAALVDITEWELYGVYDSTTPQQALVPQMTADSHGWYRSSASSIFGAGAEAYLAFDGATNNRYLSAGGVYASSDGAYIGAVTTTTNQGTIAGEYLDVSFPSGVVPVRVGIMPQADLQTRCPQKFSIVGSNDGTTWTVLGRFSGIAVGQYSNLTFTSFSLAATNNTQSWKTLRLIAEQVYAAVTFVGFSELQFYGYESPTFVTPARMSSSTATPTPHAAVTLVPSAILAGGLLAPPPGTSVSELLGVASTSPSTALQTISQRVYAPTPTNTHKLTRAQPTPTNAAYALDALSSTAKNSIGAAFSVRRLFARYRGPLLKIRRSTDNLELDWYGNPDTLDTFLNTATGYVAVWYDQSGLGKNATAPTTAEQPRLAKDRGRYVVNFDGTSRENSKYLVFSTVNALSVWSQFNILNQNEFYSTIVDGTSFGDIGIDFGGRNYWRNFLSVTGSFAWSNATKYLVENGTQLVDLQKWTAFLGIRGSGARPLNTIARNYYSSGAGTIYRDFTGTMSDLVLFTVQVTSAQDAAVLYASRAVNDVLANTQSRGVVKASLYGSASLIASLTDSAKRVLVEGRLTRDAADLVTLGSELARLGPSLSTPLVSPAALKLAGSTWPVSFDYVIKRGNIVVTSGFSAASFFSDVKDTRPAVVVIDGNLTVDANATFTPPTRKLFTVLYITGNLTVNGSISMTARGANHSGTGDSGGYVAPQDILILAGTRDGVTNPLVPASGGAGGVGSTSVVGNAGGGGTSGGTGGGGAGGWGGSSAPVGSGTAGTSFTGGTGGGGSFTATYLGAAGEVNGGLGGVNFNGQLYSGRGAGNPDNGTGGTLVIFVGGILAGSGTIASNGSAASGGGTGGATTIGGGSSGGGSVTVLSQAGGDILGITATGGTRARSNSGLGGDGSARLLRVLSSPVVTARIRDLSALAGGAAVSTWGSWSQATAGNQPVYALGTDSKYEVAFDPDLGHFLDAGTRTFNVSTNQGFTMAVQFKFTGAVITSGSVFTIGSGSDATQMIRLLRNGSAASLRVLGGDGGSFTLSMTGGSVPQDTWVVAVVRYLNVGGTYYLQMYVNNTKVVETTVTTPLLNRTNTMTYLGRVPGASTSDFRGSMRFAAMWDRPLSDAELTSLYTSLTA